MDAPITQLSCGGILAVLIVREVMNFLRSRNGNTNSSRMESVLVRLAQESKDLHDWHKPDGRGEQTWKNSQMLEAVREMTTVVQHNTTAFERLEALLERRDFTGHARPE